MISKRIKAIASLIGNDEKVLDVGTDHAFLPVWLKRNGHTAAIAASELRKGPYENALSNLKENRIDDVQVYLTYGVDGIDFEADTIVIAGMGFNTVTGIILSRRDYFHGRKLIIQINSEVDKLRKWLEENGFAIENEVMIKDYKYYEILVIREGTMKLTDKEIRFGPFLLQQKSETFRECYRSRIEKLEKIIITLPEDHRDIARLKRQIEEYQQVIA